MNIPEINTIKRVNILSKFLLFRCSSVIYFTGSVITVFSFHACIVFSNIWFILYCWGEVVMGLWIVVAVTEPLAIVACTFEHSNNHLGIDLVIRLGLEFHFYHLHRGLLLIFNIFLWNNLFEFQNSAYHSIMLLFSFYLAFRVVL